MPTWVPSNSKKRSMCRLTERRIHVVELVPTGCNFNPYITLSKLVLFHTIPHTSIRSFHSYARCPAFVYVNNKQYHMLLVTKTSFYILKETSKSSHFPLWRNTNFHRNLQNIFVDFHFIRGTATHVCMCMWHTCMCKCVFVCGTHTNYTLLVVPLRFLFT